MVIDVADPDRSVLIEAGRIIRAGGLVAFPTETVYGLGAHALDPEATERIFAAKGRPSTDPLIVHIAAAAQARDLSSRWPDVADRLIEQFWPGPLTLVVAKSPVVPDSITANRSTVALRIPAHRVALGLLESAGVPVAAPSANRFGRISPTSADDVESELQGRYDLLLDAGATTLGVESTVLDLTGETPVLLRPGGVSADLIRSIVGDLKVLKRQTTSEADDALAPGQFLRHYSPLTPLVAVDGEAPIATDLVDALTRRGINAGYLELSQDPDTAAHDLYRVLRSGDGTAQVLLVRMVPSHGLGVAVNDRLYRASQGRVVADASDSTADMIESLVGGQGTSSTQ